MIHWGCGGAGGKLGERARSKALEQLRNNPAARKAAYPPLHRFLRRIVDGKTVTNFLLWYLIVDFIVAAAECVTNFRTDTRWISWAIPNPSAGVDIKQIIFNSTGYFLSVQIGILSIISLALALVTLIAQNDKSTNDTQIYYHQSLSYELVGSSISLTIVMIVQLFWPIQFILHKFDLGTELLIFKLALIALHLGWLVVNLILAFHFVTTTFRFAFPSTRSLLRERYTADVIQPFKLIRKFRNEIFQKESERFLPEVDGYERPSAIFSINPATYGLDVDPSWHPEIEKTFASPVEFFDIRIACARHVLRRWSRRCIKRAPIQPGQIGPRLFFILTLDKRVEGHVIWCKRQGGLPLSIYERFVLSRAFRFRSVNRGS